MALKAGYKGVKKAEADKLKNMPAIKEIGEGLTLGSDGSLDATGTTVAIEANPDGAATDDLAKLKIGDDIYAIPDNDNSKCYQTDDATESAIVDADYVPFFDASAASGAGAPRKSTWSNFVNKVTDKMGPFLTRTALSSADDLDNVVDSGVYGIGTSPTNAPESVRYCTLIVQATNDGDIRQIIIKGGNVSTAIYVRDKGGSPAAWNSWYKFTGTEVVSTP